MNEINVTPIRRGGDTELLIAARMPKMHELMSRVSAGIGAYTENRRWEHLDYFELPYYYNNGMYHTGKWGYKIFYKGGPYWNFNLSMLRAPSLDEGIEIELKPNFEMDAPAWKYLERDLSRAVYGLVDDLHKDAGATLEADFYLNEQKVTL